MLICRQFNTLVLAENRSGSSRRPQAYPGKWNKDIYRRGPITDINPIDEANQPSSQLLQVEQIWNSQSYPSSYRPSYFLKPLRRRTLRTSHALWISNVSPVLLPGGQVFKLNYVLQGGGEYVSALSQKNTLLSTNFRQSHLVRICNVSCSIFTVMHALRLFWIGPPNYRCCPPLPGALTGM